MSTSTLRGKHRAGCEARHLKCSPVVVVVGGGVSIITTDKDKYQYLAKSVC